MAIGPFASYAPPGVYTKTVYEQIPVSIVASLRIPALIGPSAEQKSIAGQEIIRGSSASADVLVANEDVAGRWGSTDADGNTTYTSVQDGLKISFQVLNYPIQSGDGTGKNLTDTTKVTVTVDGVPVPILQVDGLNGVVTIPPGTAPVGSLVLVSYYSSRKDYHVTGTNIDDLSEQVTDDEAILPADQVITYDNGVSDPAGKTVQIEVDGITKPVSFFPRTTIQVTNENIASDITAGVATLVADNAPSSLPMANEPFTLKVNGTPSTITFGTEADLAAILQKITDASIVGLTASNSGGKISLSATQEIEITTNVTKLGFTSPNNLKTNRNKVFTVSKGMFVNAQGVATNTSTDITVTGGSVASIAGQTGTITLTLPPPAGDPLTVSYKYTNAPINADDAVEVINGKFPGLASVNASKVELTSDNDIKIFSGAKALGFSVDVQDTKRNREFYVSHYPIVDGSNSGAVTNSTSRVVVLVNGLPAKVQSLDGASGKITLAQAPAVGDQVKADYYFNTWQNTFDYLPNSQVVEISSVGLAPTSTNYSANEDYILVNDGNQAKIVWGSTSVLTPGISNGTTEFGANQVQHTVISTRVFKEDLADGNDQRKSFTLAHVPVMASGDALSNGRYNVATTDHADIIVYVNDTPTPVVRVDGSTIYLESAPASNAKVEATYYYNRLVRDTYTLEVVSQGTSGTGTYYVSSGATYLYGIDSLSGTITTSTFPSESTTICDGFYADPASITGDKEYSVTITSSDDFTIDDNDGDVKTGCPLGKTVVMDDGFTVTVMDGTNGQTFNIFTNNTFTASNTVPNYSIPGIELIVSNTVNAGVDSTAILETYNLNSGREPSVGSSYYVDYKYMKTNYEPRVYSDLRSIVAEFGDPTPENHLSLAARLAILNGATVVALKQVKKVGNTPPTGAYVAAIDEMKKPIGGTVKPHVIATLSADPSIAQYLKEHCIEMSAPRMDSERIGVVGVGLGTTPSGVQTLARGLNSELMMVVYPDSFVAPITDLRSGAVTNRLVDGTFAAAALAGSLCSTSLDVATPVTRRTVAGLSAVGRVLDPTEANQVAVSGVTVMESVTGGVQVRHGLTTNTSTVLTRTPSVTMTVHDIQRSLRSVLDPFIGQKFVSNIPTEVEARARSMFQGKIDQNIVSKLVDLIVYVDQDDPTVLRLEAVYVPVFPLEYIVCNMSIRVRA